MDNNSNSKVVTLLVIIIFLLIGGIGLLSYKLFFTSNEEKDGNKENNNTSVENINDNNTSKETNAGDTEETIVQKDELIEKLTTGSSKVLKVEGTTVSDLEELFNSFDSNANKVPSPKVSSKERKTNMKNLDKSEGGYKIVVNCSVYSDKYCNTYTVKVNKAIEYDVREDGCSLEGYIYKYNNYYILIKEEGCSSKTTIIIYDNNYKKMYQTKNAYSYPESEEDALEAKPVIRNGKLYFLEDADENNETMNLTEVDLSKNTLKTNIISKYYLTHISE